MKRGTNLKIQYSLKKIYTYNFFRFLNKLNVVFLKNNFNYFYFFKNFHNLFFHNLFFRNLKFSKNMLFFYKIDKKCIFFSSQHHTRYFHNLSGKNYIINYNNEYIKDNLYNSVFKINYHKKFGNKLLVNDLNYW